MAFDEIELPLRVGFGSKGGPNFSTEIITIDSGYERRNQNWAQARRTYDARSGVRSAADAATLLNFFHARAGRARTGISFEGLERFFKRIRQFIDARLYRSDDCRWRRHDGCFSVGQKLRQRRRDP